MLSNNFVKHKEMDKGRYLCHQHSSLFLHFFFAPRLENTWEKLDQETQISVTALKTFSLNNLLAIIVSGLPDATKNYINKVLLNIGEIYKTVSYEHF